MDLKLRKKQLKNVKKRRSVIIYFRINKVNLKGVFITHKISLTIRIRYIILFWSHLLILLNKSVIVFKEFIEFYILIHKTYIF